MRSEGHSQGPWSSRPAWGQSASWPFQARVSVPPGMSSAQLAHSRPPDLPLVSLWVCSPFRARPEGLWGNRAQALLYLAVYEAGRGASLGCRSLTSRSRSQGTQSVLIHFCHSPDGESLGCCQVLGPDCSHVSRADLKCAAGRGAGGRRGPGRASEGPGLRHHLPGQGEDAGPAL